MTEPDIVAAIRRSREQLYRGEQAHLEDMVRRWRSVERSLQGNIELLAREAAELQAQGRTMSISRLLEMERYQQLLVQIRRELAAYTQAIEPIIAARQAELTELGVNDALAVLGRAGVDVGFNRLNPRAFESMAGIAGDGSPLRDLLERSWPDAVGSLTEMLLRGTALGVNPRKTALEMSRATGASLNRMMAISRTESLRAYREASRQQYIASGVVSGYKRLSAKSPRTCLACLVSDGKVYPLDEPLDEHVSGRCTSVPIVDGMPEITWRTGQAWLASLPSNVQRSIMGKGRYELWRAGKVGMDELVTVTSNPVWGNAIQPTPLRALNNA